MIAVRRLAAPLSLAEAEALSDLHGRAFDGPDGRWSRRWSPAEISALAAAPGALVLAAEKAGATRGVAVVRAAGDEAEVLTVATDPSARRKGVAAALLRDSITRLEAAGVAELFLEVAEKNHAAIALYESIGFKKIAARRDYYAFPGGGRDNALVFKARVGRRF